MTAPTLFIEKANRLYWPLMLVFAGSIILAIPIVQAAALLLTALMLANILLDKTPSFRSTPFDTAYIAFVIARILSIFFSVDVAASLDAFSKEIVYYGVFFVVTRQFPIEDRGKVRLILWVLVGAGIVAAIYGSTVYFLGIKDRAASTTSGPVTLGLYLTAITPFALVLGRHREFAPKRWTWIISVGILVVGIFCTLNRIHWGILVLMLALMGFFRERRLLAFLALGVILAIVSPPITSRIVTSTANMREFMNDRNVIWSGAADRALERPLTGFGPRTFRQVFPATRTPRDKKVGSWHNDFVQVYMESGLVGLVPFLWIMVLVFWKGIKSWKEMLPGTLDRDFLLALLLAMGVFYLSALVGGFVIDPLNSLLFRFLLGFLGLVTVRSAPAAK